MYSKTSTYAALLAVIAICTPSNLFAATKILPPPPLKVLAGEYQGTCVLTDSVNNTIAYSPIRVTVTKKGKVSGTAFRTLDEQNQLETVTGTVTNLKRVTFGSGRLAQKGIKGKARITICDGGKLVGDTLRLDGESDGYMMISAAKGDFKGTCTLSKAIT